jgi:hypothetical protein
MKWMGWDGMVERHGKTALEGLELWEEGWVLDVGSDNG